MRFKKGVWPPKWEYAYWGATIKRWYREGLPEQCYPAIPTRISTTAASLYTTAWTLAWQRQRSLFEKIYGERECRLTLPDGIAVWGACSTGRARAFRWIVMWRATSASTSPPARQRRAALLSGV